MARVLAIDPGSSTGYAVLEAVGRRVKAVLGGGVWKTAGWTGLDYVNISEGEPADVVVVEDQYLGVNPATMAALVEMRARWMQVYEGAGAKVLTVRPAQWQTAMLSGIFADGRPMNTRSKRAQRKAACVAWAKRTYGLDVGEDQADALAQGTYAIKSGMTG